MKLLYFQGDHPNFGDDLNPLLWPRLAPQLFQDGDADSFLGIGTIIGMVGADADRLHVFSSGAGYRTADAGLIARCRFWCVRGPLTARMLGLDADVALTDGAILTPAVLPAPPPQRDIVVVPHWETILAGAGRNGWQTACQQAGMTLVSPVQPPALVVARIAAASLVLAESLHGAIVADSYGVPWIAFATSSNFSVFKWMDWTRSVGVPLRLHLLRPPDTALLRRVGRPTLGPWGACIEPDEAAAAADVRQRNRPLAELASQPASPIRQTLKQAVDETPALRALLGYSPARTAAALARLARAEPSLSDAAGRARLAARMTERLAALVRERQHMPVTQRGAQRGG
jgi:succinoglycan biosynthesis protein ExoV